MISARVFARPYALPDAPWEELGTTPIDTLPFVAGVISLRLELAGFETTEDIIWNRFFQSDDLGYMLRAEGSIPEDMVWASASILPQLGVGGWAPRPT